MQYSNLIGFISYRRAVNAVSLKGGWLRLGVRFTVGPPNLWNQYAINPLFEQVCYISDNFNFKKRNLYLPYNGNAVTTVFESIKRVNNVIPQIGNNYAEGSNPLRRYG